MATREELLDEAAEYDIAGRHQMKKDELEKAIAEAKEGGQDEGSQVSDEAQEALEEESDDVAAQEDVEGEAGTDVADGGGTVVSAQAADDPASGEGAQEQDKAPSKRGVGFFR